MRDRLVYEWCGKAFIKFVNFFEKIFVYFH